MRSSKPILLVEDDQVDAMTVKRALKEINVTNRLDIVDDGEKALAFLENPENENPGIILLDLNMPRMNGIEFLHIVKKDDMLQKIPVIVLTTSREDQDKVDSFKLGVAGYMVKPVDYLKFVEVVKTIDLYWTLSELPE
ncbi:MAG: response regulator [Proteobacteria bacterium]|nr:response regulator [Pseudomonadota bacterium]MBU1232077.1 response regulator [Pseudomonadota bacterium]MBU1416879.1 response regulator [Pseudomonadota bacterium]MBU1454709.1 response regulator [Pseudomonadota bacterium]